MGLSLTLPMDSRTGSDAWNRRALETEHSLHSSGLLLQSQGQGRAVCGEG